MPEPIESPVACTTCSNGRLLFRFDEDGQRVFLECEECMTGFWNVLEPGESFRTEESATTVRFASPSEVQEAVRRGAAEGKDAGMDPQDRRTLVADLSGLTQADFLATIRDVFTARREEVRIDPFTSTYVLGVAHGLNSDSPSDWEVEIFAEPTSPELADGPLSQQGACTNCGYEAIAASKTAQCGVCGRPVELT